MRVLVVDDNPLVRRAITRLLSTMDCSTVAAGTLAEAHAALDADPSIEVVLTDHGLSDGEHGEDLLTWCMEHAPALVRILSSAAPEETLSGSSAHAFLAKPFDGPRLREALERAVKAARG